MPRSCSAAGCRERDTAENRTIGMTFHAFPKDDELRSKWVRSVGRVDPDNKAKMWKPGTAAVLCSKHFQQNDFQPYGFRRKLKDDAVPSKFQLLQSKSAKKRHTDDDYDGVQPDAEQQTGLIDGDISQLPDSTTSRLKVIRCFVNKRSSQSVEKVRPDKLDIVEALAQKPTRASSYVNKAVNTVYTDQSIYDSFYQSEAHRVIQEMLDKARERIHQLEICLRTSRKTEIGQHKRINDLLNVIQDKTLLIMELNTKLEFIAETTSIL